VRTRYFGPDGTSITSMPVEVACATAPAECLVSGTFAEVPPASQFVPNIVPILECIVPIDNNNFLGYFGYSNLESSFYTVPVGPLNTFSGNADRGQSTNFLSGRSEFFPRVAFATTLAAGSHSWRLTNFDLSFDTSDSARYCPESFFVGVQLTNSTEISGAELDIIESNIEKQLNLDPAQVAMKGVSIVQSKIRVEDTLSQLEVEISTSTSQNEPADPQEIIQDFVRTIANVTAAQEVFNPLNDTTREILGVKTQPTGLEQEGTAIPAVAAPAFSSGYRLSLDLQVIVILLSVSLASLVTHTTSSLATVETK
jgi:hypothetical protein